MYPLLLTAILGVVVAADVHAQSAAGVPVPLSTRDSAMRQFDRLVGIPWTATGSGFSTTLTYSWVYPGTMLDAANEVKDEDGRVIGRYSGAYAWDADREEIAFWTASESGELHRGRAWWRDGVLWHEATVTGGALEGYASAVRHSGDRLEYFADYSRLDAGPYLLATNSLVYEREAASQPDGPLAPLAFMSGCWRGEPGAGSALEEFYTSPSANLMLGLSRFLRGGRAVQFEFSTITTDSSGVVLLPYPGGRPSEHGFRLTQVEQGSALFEAPEHDFPKRIRYTLAEDGALVARIDGGEGDQRVQQWRMEAVSCRM